MASNRCRPPAGTLRRAVLPALLAQAVVLASLAGLAAGAAPARGDADILGVRSSLDLYGPDLRVTAITRGAERVSVLQERRHRLPARPARAGGGRQRWDARFPSRAVRYRGRSYRVRVQACPDRGGCDTVTRRFRVPTRGPSPTAVPQITSVVPRFDPDTRRLTVTVTGRHGDEVFATLRNYVEADGDAVNPLRLVDGEVDGSSVAAVFRADGLRLAPGQTLPLGVAIDNSRSLRTRVLPNAADAACVDLSLPPLSVPELEVPSLPLPPVPVLPGLPRAQPAIDAPALRLPSLPGPELSRLGLPCIALPTGSLLAPATGG